MALLVEIAKVFKRAPQCGAFLMLLSLSSLSPPIANAASCTPCRGKLYEVTSVYDGDTLHLRDGRTIRLIGINTPELGRLGADDDPGAQRAKQALERLVDLSDRQVKVCAGVKSRDRYRRQLAHLYTKQGDNINRQLIQLGVGYAIAVPPNLKNLACYATAENRARVAGLGVWGRSVQEASSLRGDETGFHLLRGYIIRVGQSRSGVWLNLEGGLALRITWDDWKSFAIEDPESLLYSLLEARGWIYLRNGQQRLRVRHAASVRWMES